MPSFQQDRQLLLSLQVMRSSTLVFQLLSSPPLLVMDQSDKPCILTPIEQKQECLIVHQVLKEDLKTVVCWQKRVLVLEQVEEV